MVKEKLIFKKGEIMSIKIEMEKDPKEIMELMEKNTGRKLQEVICEDIKQEVEKNNTFSLENEEVLEDDSILLTLTLN